MSRDLNSTLSGDDPRGSRALDSGRSLEERASCREHDTSRRCSERRVTKTSLMRESEISRSDVIQVNGTRIPHQLKAAVTSLKITNIPPRTVYRLVVRRLPSDVYSSEVSGRSFSQDAPPPVEDLEARALTNSSIQIEWKSRSADGFVAQILRNNTLVQEKSVADVSSHSIINITNLEPSTEYRVQVTAFYFPPAGNSVSPLSSVIVRTLPAELPSVKLDWELDSKLRLSWKNPGTPKPVLHTLTCYGDSNIRFSVRLSGNTDFFAWEDAQASRELICRLETWFSAADSAKTTASIIAIKPAREEDENTLTILCHGWPLKRVKTWVNESLEKINEVMESMYLTFHVKPVENHSESLRYFVVGHSGGNGNIQSQVEYRLCERGYACNDSWIMVPEDEFARHRLNLKPWMPTTVEYRFAVR